MPIRKQIFERNLAPRIASEFSMPLSQSLTCLKAIKNIAHIDFFLIVLRDVYVRLAVALQQFGFLSSIYHPQIFFVCNWKVRIENPLHLMY